MTYLFPNYNRAPLELVRGEGCHLFDENGRNYLDFTSGIGVCNLGYNHPKLTAALHAQVDQIWHVPNLYQSDLQETVAEKLGGDLGYVAFFCNSGAEANEAAIKLARRATGRCNIVSCRQSFHGRTFGAMTATGQAKVHDGFGPLVPGFSYINFNDKSNFESAITSDTAAVIVEVVQGEGGLLPADGAWLRALAAHAHSVGALLIIDEVQTGFGRTGTLFAFQQFDIQPDLVTMAKALGNGVPVGAMMAKRELSDVFSVGVHGTTYGGNRLALSVANEVLDLVNNPAFLSDVQAKGQLLQSTLKAQLVGNPHVIDVRGLGLMVGIELDSPESLQVAKSQLQAEGLLVLGAGQTVMRLLPPLVVSEEELLLGAEKIIATLAGLGAHFQKDIK